MLKQLSLNNIVLVESSNIPFEGGLNVLSGETGSGKSAIMNALDQIAGARADTNLIRKGADKGVIEAVFDIDQLPKVKQLLADAGIAQIDGEEMIISREISKSGKGRAFVNNQLIHLATLKRIGENLLEIVGQHANQRLLDIGEHLKIVDLFGDLDQPREQFKRCWEEVNTLTGQLEELINNEAKRLREIEVCKIELEELDQASIKEGEEEVLFAEYSKLSNTEELVRLSSEIYQALSGDHNPVIATLSLLEETFRKLITLDPSLEESSQSLHSSKIELEEVAHTLRNYMSSLESHPSNLEEVNQRLTLINQMKRKFGPSVSDVVKYQQNTEVKLESLEHADIQIEELSTRLENKTQRCDFLATQLTKKRGDAANILQDEITRQLQALNMPNAQFTIEITAKTRTQAGDDQVEFFFAPNVGEKSISIKECASGGELSRIMLTLKAILAGKEHTPTLIFDEVDANIGGQTATVVGEKLLQIGKNHQVISITHFPQVAKCAQHHLQISKKHQGGRTVTQIRVLDNKSRKQELLRMAGVNP